MLRPSQGATAWGEELFAVVVVVVVGPSRLTELPARLLIRVDWKGLILQREIDDHGGQLRAY